MLDYKKIILNNLLIEDEEWHKYTRATFSSISSSLANELMDFASYKNLNKEVEIGKRKYRLLHISHKTSSFFKSRGISVYFQNGNWIIRISDHWSESNHFERSQKLNCVKVSTCVWKINNKKSDAFYFSGLGSRKYDYRMIGGRIQKKNFENLPVPEKNIY